MISGDPVREELARLTPLEAAPRLLGARLQVVSGGDIVAVRITEAEAYWGVHDPGSHGSRGQTPRNEVMFGPAGKLYAYLTYGMHVCVNVVTGSVSECAAVLLRAGEVVEGQSVARGRRTAFRRKGARALREHELARGPANLARSLGLGVDDNGVDLFRPGGRIQLEMPEIWQTQELAPRIRRSLRTGVAVPGGEAPYDWRWWLTGEPSVSPYQPHRSVRANLVQ